MEHITIGILAHVDAGKTTLSESLLYLSGAIRKAGRVDNKDAFLDTHELEQSRGITIFSKQAVFSLDGTTVTLLDTPGHVDFSAETERTLQVLDYAVLVVSGADGVQGHTRTLWKLLRRHKIPVFIFVNKMDQIGTSRENLLKDLKTSLHENCVDFSVDMRTQIFRENIAMCDEKVLETYLECGELSDESICSLIAKRRVFPCYFGSALKMTGVEDFLEGIARCTQAARYPGEFGAKVYKIARDEKGTRLTYLKVTGGTLKVRNLVLEEKVSQIRIYSGAKYEAAEEVPAGTVCAVTGLTKTTPGQGLGIQKESDMPALEPVLNYRMELPPDCDAHNMLKKLRQLEEEEPQMHMVWEERLSEIHVRLMGEIQTEVLQSLILNRFGVHVRFGSPSIIYKETIENTVEGVGHFEPLRHYAEVHLLLEPGEQDSGLCFDADCSGDVLDKNWQRLILTHLKEREHPGVLTGSGITDLKITVIGGKAHLKHTEGGDFRQAAYRAVRQGLKMAKSILLEPYYRFRLELPQGLAGRAMADIERMGGQFELPIQEGGVSVLTGAAPVSSMGDYHREVISYSKGVGRFFCSLDGYRPCRNQEEVVKQTGYDSERDTENPTGSVFCAHGAGFVVPWNEVRRYMHVDTKVIMPEPEDADAPRDSYEVQKRKYEVTEKELEAIFERTYGPRKERAREAIKRVRVSAPQEKPYRGREKTGKKEYLLVDGYNIIFAWEDLKALADENLNAARDKLMDILSNYQAVKDCCLILVFDAYKVQGGTGFAQTWNNIHVVFTKEAETADQYIEKTAHEIGRKQNVTVATSDGLEQIIIRGQGCRLLSARELREEIARTGRQIQEEIENRKETHRNYFLGHAGEELARDMEQVRLGNKDVADLFEGK